MTDASDVARAWATIEAVLEAERPDIAASLRPPATDEQLARLAAVVGDLPDDLVASLRIHDGQDDPAWQLGIHDVLSWLGVDAMLEAHALRLSALGDGDEPIEWMTPDRVRTVMNSRGWLPFTDFQGSGHAIDLDPLPAGTRGQVIWLPIDGPTPAPVAPSYGAWLVDVAERLANGEVDPAD
ncbi:SMI1/KNR4 family protein [Agrococcus jejuensis]|uniref:Cell wall assembly regulator SMI1 n=1 Tax=Agrococcus jejuensis TaxID=399736 RepID=A0A1G8G195_9MICO|nr:SMI1/KNR4 family protein [Agrococcus jejuensis]SDH88161.1 Cell wall assembly regulator SMI1 [Agrococcus jejuensis]